MVTLEQIKFAFLSRPKGTEFVQISDDRPYHLRQCKESSEFLYWNDWEWTPTELMRDEELIPIGYIKMIIELESSNKLLSSRADDAAEEVKQLKKQLEFYQDIESGSQGVTGWHLNGDVATWDELRSAE